MSASAVRMAMATVLSTRPSLARSPSACVKLVAVVCVVPEAKVVLVLVVMERAVSVVRRARRKEAAPLLLDPREIVPQVALKVVVHPAAQKVGVLVSVALAPLKVVGRALPVAACLVIPRSPSNAWTRTPMAVSPRKNMSPR